MGQRKSSGPSTFFRLRKWPKDISQCSLLKWPRSWRKIRKENSGGDPGGMEKNRLGSLSLRKPNQGLLKEQSSSSEKENLKHLPSRNSELLWTSDCYSSPFWMEVYYNYSVSVQYCWVCRGQITCLLFMGLQMYVIWIWSRSQDPGLWA